jgi:hypothetical protein
MVDLQHCWSTKHNPSIGDEYNIGMTGQRPELTIHFKDQVLKRRFTVTLNHLQKLVLVPNNYLCIDCLPLQENLCSIQYVSGYAYFKALKRVPNLVKIPAPVETMNVFTICSYLQISILALFPHDTSPRMRKQVTL